MQPNTLDWIIIVQMLVLLAILIAQFLYRRRVVNGNPHMPAGTKSGDVEVHYWMSRLDELSRNDSKLLEAMNNCTNELAILNTLIKERLPRS